MTVSVPSSLPARPRLSVELSPSVSLLLDHVADVTGESKAGIVSAALLAALPEILARADGLKKRVGELTQASAHKRK